MSPINAVKDIILNNQEYIDELDDDAAALHIARYIVKSLEAHGFVIVPKKPTDEMMLFGHSARLDTQYDSNFSRSLEAIWTAMIEAREQNFDASDDEILSAN